MHFHHCEIILFDHMYRKRKSSVHVNDLKTSFFEFESFSLSSDWMIIQLVLCMIVQYLKIQYRCQLVFMTVKYKDSQGPLSKAHKKKKRIHHSCAEHIMIEINTPKTKKSKGEGFELS